MFGSVLILLSATAIVSGSTIPSIDIFYQTTDNPTITSNEVDEGPNVCATEACARESAIVRSYLDESVDPCYDFYDFACGKYIRETVLPDDKPIQMSFVEVQDNVEKQLQTIITEEVDPNEPKPFKLAKLFNKVCMDEITLNRNGCYQCKYYQIFRLKLPFPNLGITPMVNILEKHFGGWPVVKGNDWKSEDWDWMEVNKKLSDDGLSDSLILTFHIIIDSKNSTRRTLAVSSEKIIENLQIK